ncbi:MAG: cytochrome c biogenesis protein CcdA [Acidobacteria bacterium]|nr:cytochrome c biogenesis protein CcdA [Acidobacteriota bacterium]
MEPITLAAAVAAGLLSFVSPCVLPLVPGYLSFVSGLTVGELRQTAAPVSSSRTAWHGRRKVLLASLAFVAGFSMVFVALGASATAVGGVLLSQLTVLGKVAGVVLVLFGLHTVGVLRLGWLNASKRAQAIRKPASLAGALLVGVSFAFGWTPCIGPILAGILAIAAAQDSVTQGVQLLAGYSLGLAVPFMATSLAVDRFFAASARIQSHFRAIEIASGVFLVAVGTLMFTNRFTLIAQYLAPYLPAY